MGLPERLLCNPFFVWLLGIVYHVSARLATQKATHAVDAGGFSLMSGELYTSSGLHLCHDIKNLLRYGTGESLKDQSERAASQPGAGKSEL